MPTDRDSGGARARALTAFVAAFFAVPGAAPLSGRQVGADESAPAAAPSALDAHLAVMPLARTARVATGIHLDGRLDEPEWQAVTPITEFYQTDPQDGPAATERTEVWILFDEDALYIGARMWESTGDVKKRLGRRDSFLMDSDWFYVGLDTYHGHTNAYQFAVNPAGVKRDEITGSSAGPRMDASWDAVWDASTTTDAEGWTAELRIPFSQLRYSRANSQVWGLQISRRAISKEETAVFAHTPKSQRGGVARYGHLVGLEGLQPGRKFEALPYAVTRAEYLDVQAGNPYRDGSDMFAGAGLDLKYRVTSAMTLDATFNPDFGQVEQDPAVVNLTAFETSFDEKRPFFVEGADIFRFSELRIFYSRRIGRQPQGSLPAGTAYSDRPDNSTILGAAKLTGRTQNGWNLGVVQALTSKETAPWVDDEGLTGETVVEPMTNYLAARAEKNLRDGQTQFGGILTAVNRNIEGDELASVLRSSGYSGGLDFSHEFLNRTWAISGYFAWSRINGSTDAILRAQRFSARYYQRPDADYLAIDSALTTLDGYAARFAVNKTAGLHWRGDANVSLISPGFEINDMGFQTAADRIGADVNMMYVENRVGDLFRNYRISLRTARDWNYGGDGVGLRSTLSLNGSLVNYWSGHVNFTRSFTSYDDRLTRGGPVTRDLADNRVELQLSTDSRKAVSSRSTVNYTWSESGGWSRQANTSLTLRPAEFWTFTIGPRFNQTRAAAQYLGSLADESATATFGRRYIFSPIEQTTLSMETRLNVNFSPDLSFDLYAQPFVSTGDYGDPMQLVAPRVFEFEPYTGNSVGRTDFNTQSLRGNAVLRWEWRPGSTLFLVWQQSRSGSGDEGSFDFGRDAGSIFDTRPQNVFLVKMNYWLNL